MNREEAKELLPIIQAFADEKDIQFRCDENSDWQDVKRGEGLTFNHPSSHYRIKTEPKYRPFRTQKECWDEMHKHSDFGWLKNKGTGVFASIGCISERKDKQPLITWASNEGFNFLASDVLNDYTFTDGEPFGIKEE